MRSTAISGEITLSCTARKGMHKAQVRYSEKMFKEQVSQEPQKIYMLMFKTNNETIVSTEDDKEEYKSTE